MYYCERCRSVEQTEICQSCGRKQLPAAQERDAVLLTVLSGPWAQMLVDMLSQEGIIPIIRNV